MADDEVSEDARSQVRAFLIADVRGYTRFTQEEGDEEAARLAGRFAELARRGITGHDGELLELRGDEALGVFVSARDALRAAVDLQRLFRAGADDVPGLPLGVGIGIDAGEAMPVEGGYRGAALNLAARLCSRAAPGEILASETVTALARSLGGIRFVDRGVERFKGFDDPVGIVEIVPEAGLPPVPSLRWSSVRRFTRRHVTRRNAVAAGLIALVAAAVSAAGLALGPRAGIVGGTEDAARVGLVLPREPTASEDVFAPYRKGLIAAARQYGIDPEVIIDDASRPLSEDVRNRVADLDLVLVAGTTAQQRLGAEIPRNPDTRFVYLDTQNPFVAESAVRHANFSDIYFSFGPAAYQAGYLSVLMATRSTQKGSKRPIVSVVAVGPDLPPWHETGFVAGARAADARAVVLVDYVGLQNVSTPFACTKLANRQIDKGSRVVFAAAGACGLGALSAAGVRGVWGVGADVDRSYLGPHILVSAVKRTDRAVEYAITSFLDGTLHQGLLDIGPAQDAVGIVGINPVVPRNVRAALVEEVERHDGWER